MLLLGDCNDHLKEINDNSIDLIVTDPPYGYSFMGKDWDKAVVSTDTWRECYRVLKQGKLAFIMCSPRQDVLARMIINLQDAGFRTNYSSIYWAYSSGFPKARNLGSGAYSGAQMKPAVEIILIVSKPNPKRKTFTTDDLLKEIEQEIKQQYQIENIEWED